jgi:hypothetical protein
MPKPLANHQMEQAHLAVLSISADPVNAAPHLSSCMLSKSSVAFCPAKLSMMDAPPWCWSRKGVTSYTLQSRTNHTHTLLSAAVLLHLHAMHITSTACYRCVPGGKLLRTTGPFLTSGNPSTSGCSGAAKQALSIAWPVLPQCGCSCLWAGFHRPQYNLWCLTH